MLVPKRVKHRREFRGKMRGEAKGGKTIAFGEYGLEAVESHWITNRQIEAARIDGASPVQIFNHITFPQILFVMSPALIQQFIGNINNFNVIYLLTGGAPMNNNYNGAGSTDLLVTWLYNLTFGQEQRYNASAVLGILIFIISATFSLIAYRHTNAYKEG